VDYSVKFLGRQEVASGIFSYRFERPEGFAYRAGQYFILHLSETLVKPFSFSSSPFDMEYIEFTTRVSESDFKKRLVALGAGDVVSISSPLGSFILGDSKKLAFLAGGIGVTPHLSMLREISGAGLDYDVCLFYGVRNEKEIVCRRELDEMQDLNKNIRIVYVISDEKHEGSGCYSGLICEDIVGREISNPFERTYMVCGPPAMVSAMEKMLGDMGVPKDKVIVERFPGA
jgi:glycine betaine catabolism B